MPTRSRPGPRRVRAVLAEHRDAHRRRAAGRGRSGPMFHCSSVPGRKFSTTTSAVAASRRNRSWPSARAQVERDALAAAALDRPEQRVRAVVAGVDERTDLAHEVAAARLLDLDDLGALLAEQARAERRGDARAEVEDAQARERTAHCSPARARPARASTASMPPALRASTLAERGRRVRHELVEHEVVAPALALAHAVDHVVDRRLHHLGRERRDERDLARPSRAAAAASSARGTTRLTSP